MNAEIESKNNPVKELIINRTYGSRVFWLGIAMSVLLIFTVVYYGLTDFERAKTLVLAFFVHAFGGRAAGVGLCIMNGLNSVWTITYNFYLEVLIVCFTYSVFVLAMRRQFKSKWVVIFRNNMMDRANYHKSKIEKYGWIGIFIFVMIPLPVTGPVVGSIIGYLLNMKVWRNLSAVFLGTLIAIIIWFVFFDFLEQYLHIIQYVLAGIIGIVLLSHFKTIKNWLGTKIK